MHRKWVGVMVIVALTGWFAFDAAYSQPPRVRPGGGGSPGGEARPGDWPRTRTPSRDRSESRAYAARAVPTFSGTGPPSRNWRLGIYDERAPRGIRISRVLSGSPASDIGLEVGDYILDISGYVVGEYDGTFYPLAMAMDYGADSSGWAELLIWNKRTYAEQTIWVRFDRR